MAVFSLVGLGIETTDEGWVVKGCGEEASLLWLLWVMELPWSPMEVFLCFSMGVC